MPSEMKGNLYGKTLDFSDVISVGGKDSIGKDLVRIDSAGIRWWKLFGFDVFEP